MISQDIKLLIEFCPVCVKHYVPHHEPLHETLCTNHEPLTWQKVATDLFTLTGTCYLVVVDYFSRYPEVIQLRSTTSGSVVEALKAIFARHGIPETVVSDNGPQYASEEFSKLAAEYSFK